MIKILGIIGNTQEAQVLEIAFKQKAFSVISSLPHHANYVRCLQYSPDLIMMEIIPPGKQQFDFIKLIKKNRRTFQIPILAYGSTGQDNMIRDLRITGVNHYYNRPLKFTQILRDMEFLLRGKNLPQLKTDKLEDDKRAAFRQLLFDPNRKPAVKLEEMTKYIGKLMAFPFSISKILTITKDTRSGAEDLALAIQSDAAITATILKVANSVLFASRNRTVSDIKEAVVRLGFEETKNIALCITVMKNFGGEAKSEGYNRMEFWCHNLACGLLAERMAKNCGLRQPEEAFTAGLLNDFGILIYDESFRDVFDILMQKVTERGLSFMQIEHEVLGFNHTELSALLFEKWKIPPYICAAVLGSNRPKNSALPTDQRAVLLTNILMASNIVAKALNIGRECDQWVEPIPNQLLQEIRLPGGFSEGFFRDFDNQFRLFKEFLNLDETLANQSESKTEKADKPQIAVINRSYNLFEPHLHYLQTQPYVIVDAKTPEDLESLELPLDRIIFNSGRELHGAEQLRPFTKIIRKTVDATSANLEKVPLIVFYEEGIEVGGLDQEVHIKKMPKKLDLRNLTALIEAPFPPPEAESPKNKEGTQTAELNK